MFCLSLLFSFLSLYLPTFPDYLSWFNSFEKDLFPFLSLFPFVIISKNLVNLLLKLSQNHFFFLSFFHLAFCLSFLSTWFVPSCSSYRLLRRRPRPRWARLQRRRWRRRLGSHLIQKPNYSKIEERERKLRTLARLLPLSFDPGTKAWLIRRLGWFKALALHCPGAWAWSTNHLMQTSLDARCVATSKQHLSSKAWLMGLDRWVSRWNMTTWM